MNMDTNRTNGPMYETRDFNTRFVWSSAWVLLGLMFAGLFASFLIYAAYSKLWTAQDARNQPSRLEATLPVRPPEPRLQVIPAQDLSEFRARQGEELHSYGWVEPAAGVVHIPIERAMELTLERGLPAREAQGKEESGKGKASSAPVKKP